MIEVKDLSKAYQGNVVLNIPNLTIPKGESFGLVGNNGAGKTTFFRLILDLIRPNSGAVYINSENVMGSIEWKRFTGSYLDEGFLIDFLTPEEYFGFLADINGLSKGDVTEFYDTFEEFFNNEVLAKKKFIRELSSGNQKKVGIAAAMMTRPELLILDEPFNSLDPTTQIRLKKMLKEVREDRNITALISSHDLLHVTEVCERIAVLEVGNVIKDIKTTSSTLQDLEKYFSV
ncbi:MAG: ABC transporter ATP-binding protein [Bacteroidales bacterium]|jgi:ABC-2 type transport system ATP-binding protein|nr:ABC transporter ATP-binding protein [Bacteroidales bacterium]